MATNDPRPLTREELAKFLPNQRAIRAFEQLFSLNPDAFNTIESYLNATKITPISVAADYSPDYGNLILLVDASLGPVIITLPDATNAIDPYYGSYYTIAVAKVDTSSNSVTIVGSLGQTVIGEASQVLLLDGEVINSISDGVNWEIAA